MRKFLPLLLLLFCVNAEASITATGMDSGTSSADATSYATNSWTPGANKLELLCIMGQKSSGVANVPTVTGNNLTWVNVISSSGGQSSFDIYRAMGSSPTTGVTTIDYAGQTQANFRWSIVEFSGIDTSGSNGSGAIVQSVSGFGTGTTSTATLSSFGNSSNMAFGHQYHYSADATNPGAGFTEVHDVTTSDGADNIGIETEYQLNQTSVTSTWSSNVFWEAFGVEIKIAPTNGLYSSTFYNSTLYKT